MIHFKMSTFSFTVYKFGLKFENILPTLNLNHKIHKKCNTPTGTLNPKSKTLDFFANCMHNYKKKLTLIQFKNVILLAKKSNFSTTKLQLDRKELQPFAFMFDQQKKTNSWPKKTRWPTSVPRVDSTKAKKKDASSGIVPATSHANFSALFGLSGTVAGLAGQKLGKRCLRWAKSCFCQTGGDSAKIWVQIFKLCFFRRNFQLWHF